MILFARRSPDEPLAATVSVAKLDRIERAAPLHVLSVLEEEREPVSQDEAHPTTVRATPRFGARARRMSAVTRFASRRRARAT